MEKARMYLQAEGREPAEGKKFLRCGPWGLGCLDLGGRGPIPSSEEGVCVLCGRRAIKKGKAGKGVWSCAHGSPVVSLYFPVLPCFIHQGQCRQLFTSSGIHMKDDWEGGNVVGCSNQPSALSWGLWNLPMLGSSDQDKWNPCLVWLFFLSPLPDFLKAQTSTLNHQSQCLLP